MIKQKTGGGQSDQPKKVNIISKAVIDRLIAALGDASATLLLHHLEKNCSLKLDEILERPAAFSAELKNIFGEGASIIETLIVKALYAELGLRYRKIKKYEFADYVKHARKKLRNL